MGIPADVGVTRGVWAPKGTPKDVISKSLKNLLKKQLTVKNSGNLEIILDLLPNTTLSSQFLDLLNLEQGVYTDIKGKFMSK